MVERKKREKEKEKKKSAFSLALSHILVNKEWNDWLKWLQNLFKWITDYGEFIVGLFQWSHTPTSCAILIILIFTTVYSCILPFSHIVLVVGTYILTCCTIGVQTVQNIIINFSLWLFRYRVVVEEQEKDIQIGCYTNKSHYRRKEMRGAQKRKIFEDYAANTEGKRTSETNKSGEVKKSRNSISIKRRISDSRL